MSSFHESRSECSSLSLHNNQIFIPPKYKVAMLSPFHILSETPVLRSLRFSSFVFSSWLHYILRSATGTAGRFVCDPITWNSTVAISYHAHLNKLHKTSLQTYASMHNSYLFFSFRFLTVFSDNLPLKFPLFKKSSFILSTSKFTVSKWVERFLLEHR